MTRCFHDDVDEVTRTAGTCRACKAPMLWDSFTEDWVEDPTPRFTGQAFCACGAVEFMVPAVPCCRVGGVEHSPLGCAARRAGPGEGETP